MVKFWLDGANGDVFVVRSTIGPVKRRAAVENVFPAIVRPNPRAMESDNHSQQRGSAVYHRAVDDLTFTGLRG